PTATTAAARLASTGTATRVPCSCAEGSSRCWATRSSKGASRTSASSKRGASTSRPASQASLLPSDGIHRCLSDPSEILSSTCVSPPLQSMVGEVLHYRVEELSEETDERTVEHLEGVAVGHGWHGGRNRTRRASHCVQPRLCRVRRAVDVGRAALRTPAPCFR